MLFGANQSVDTEFESEFMHSFNFNIMHDYVSFTCKSKSK